MSLQSWVGQLSAVVLLAGVAELLVPQGGMRGYARTILGLVVLVTVLRPVLGWVHQGVDWNWGAQPPPLASVSNEAAETRGIFRRLLTDQVARVAQAVPGVASADVVLVLAPGDAPAVRSAQVRVTPATTSPPADRLSAEVARAVAAALGLAPDQVAVEVDG